MYDNLRKFAQGIPIKILRGTTAQSKQLPPRRSFNFRDFIGKLSPREKLIEEAKTPIRINLQEGARSEITPARAIAAQYFDNNKSFNSNLQNFVEAVEAAIAAQKKYPETAKYYFPSWSMKSLTSPINVEIARSKLDPSASGEFTRSQTGEPIIYVRPQGAKPPLRTIAHESRHAYLFKDLLDKIDTYEKRVEQAETEPLRRYYLGKLEDAKKRFLMYNSKNVPGIVLLVSPEMLNEAPIDISTSSGKHLATISKPESNLLKYLVKNNRVTSYLTEPPEIDVRLGAAKTYYYLRTGKLVRTPEDAHKMFMFLKDDFKCIADTYESKDPSKKLKALSILSDYLDAFDAMILYLFTTDKYRDILKSRALQVIQNDPQKRRLRAISRIG